ncbi:hypothetical protein TVAG_239790 [Trichomonas vaginalis G3]|uniref:Uncharacterized protein n=1 Tax=Trichomonas vaginalis (strain ATCC PRA-98 / G3) TaxID=412133 RepID=A2EFC2_TRIV3|nr:hypothetical protein TVAGG3_0430740 [Trichomonas vaginalis G3]EAY08619.1 hypothetical protein TVAG_239790 [Trichomonas vaginalis G3]KAI5536733.1 hypothetical protein TVAGG3_0430740 [Trichomonas vaginalis G3]|eukprot:XP_001320842.1 hypothetical protein [Trichomonas vaginalis G3]
MELEYERMKEFVPSNTKSMNSACNSEIKECKHEILRKQRHLILLHLYNNDYYPHFFPSNKEEFYDYINQDADNNPDEITPETKSYLSQIYDHLLNNPADLVTLTNSASHVFDSSNLAAFYYSTIPSIYGYFSSYEHIAFGYRFYCQLLQKVQHRIFLEAVVPFFRNATTYRYIESVSESIIDLFCRDVQLLKTETNNRFFEGIADNLHDIIVKYLQLLPKTHLNLLILMFNNKYSRHDIYEFFVSQFLQPEVTDYLKSSAFSTHNKLFNSICEYLLTTADKNDFEELLMSNSLIDIPSMFGDFGQKHIDLIVTPLDGSLLSTLIRSTGACSKTLEAIGNNGPMVMQGYQTLFVRVIPTIPIHPVSSIGGKIFFDQERMETCHASINRFDYLIKFLSPKYDENYPESFLEDKELDTSSLCLDCRHKLGQGEKPEHCDTCGGLQKHTLTFKEYTIEKRYDDMYELSEAFENFIERKLSFDILKKFKSDVDRAHSNSLALHAENLIDNYLADSEQSEIVKSSHLYLKQFKLLDNQKDDMIFFAARAESLMSTVSASRVKTDLTEFEAKFSEVVAMSSIKMPTPFVKNENQSRKLFFNKRFVEIAGLLNLVTIQPFTKRFFHISKCLRYLDELKHISGAEKSLIPNALRICVDPGVVSTILKCIAMLMKKNNFVALLPKETAELWYEMENEIVNIASTDEETLLMWTRLVDALVNAF